MAKRHIYKKPKNFRLKSSRMSFRLAFFKSSPNRIIIVEHNLYYVLRIHHEMVKEQLEEYSEDIASLQIKRDEINGKIFDPYQVQEILDELTNQLDSLADKMRSDDSWQKDQLARNLFTNLENNQQKTVLYRYKEPFQTLISGVKQTKLHMVSREGFEPSTPGLKGPCSNLLSYRPKYLQYYTAIFIF